MKKLQKSLPKSKYEEKTIVEKWIKLKFVKKRPLSKKKVIKNKKYRRNVNSAKVKNKQNYWILSKKNKSIKI